MNQDLAEDDFEGLETSQGKGRLIKLGLALGFLVLLASGIFFFWQHQTKLSEQEFLTRAQVAIENAELPTAVIELKNAVRSNPRNTQTRYKLAQIYLQLSMGAEAEEQFNHARELGTDTKSLSLPLAEAHLLQRKFVHVLQEIKPDEHPQPTEHMQAVRIQADALLGLGRLQEACPLFRQALDGNPKYVPAYWGLIKCDVAKKDFISASANMSAALIQEPHNLRSLMLKGDLARATGDLAGAEAAYGEAIAIDENHIPAWLSRASMRLAAGKPGLAIEDVHAAKKRAPKLLTVRYMEASIAYKQERLTDAQNIIQGIVSSAPNHQPSRLLSGLIAFRLGQYRQADKDLSAVLLWQPENRDVRMTLAQSRLLTGQPESALSALEPLLADKRPDAEAFSAASDAYLQLGKPEIAADYLDRATSLLPDDAASHSKIGLWRLRAGDTAGAAKELEAAAKLRVLPLQTEAIRITTLLMRKDFDQAMAAAEAMTKQFPKQAIAYNMRGMAYLAKQNLKSARLSFEHAMTLQPTNVTTARSLAKMDLLQGKVDAAKSRYASVLKHDPANYQAIMELSQLAKTLGHDSEYVTWLSRAATAAPGETPPRLLLARHFLANKEPDKGLPWARQAVDLNARNPQALEVIGDIQLAIGERDNALYSYLQWTLVAPNSFFAHFKLGKAQEKAGHSISAQESLGRALRLKPDDADTAMSLAMLAQKNSRHQVAISHARLMQKHHPDMWQGHALEGDSQEAQGNHAEAVKAYSQAYKLHRSSRLFIQLHQALIRADNSHQAQQLLTAWLRDAPKDLASRLYLGYSQLMAGQGHESKIHFQAALGIEPANIPALVGMAAALDALGDSRALQFAEQAFQKSGRNAATSDLLGWMLFSQGKVQPGMELLRRAESLEPDNSTIRYHLAAALAKSGEPGTARHMLEMLLSKGGEFPKRKEAQALIKTLPNHPR